MVDTETLHLQRALKSSYPLSIAGVQPTEITVLSQNNALTTYFYPEGTRNIFPRDWLINRIRVGARSRSSLLDRYDQVVKKQ